MVERKRTDEGAATVWTDTRKIAMADRTGGLKKFTLTLLLLVGLVDSEQNIASGKQAYQSTRYLTRYASLAVDGAPAVGACTSLNSTDLQYSHTTEEKPNSWWRVDLNQPYYIYKISICNRGDYYNARLNQTYILSSNVTQSVQVIKPAHYRGSGWTDRHYFGPALGDFTTNTFSPPFYARHVAIYGGNGRGITLREVEIFGLYLNDVAISTTASVATFEIELSIEVTEISEMVPELPIRIDVIEKRLPSGTDRVTHTSQIHGTTQSLSFTYDGLHHSTMYRYTVELFVDGVKFKETSEEFTTLPFTCETPGLISVNRPIQQTVNRTATGSMVDLRLQWSAPNTGCLDYDPNILSYAVMVDGTKQNLAQSVGLTELTLTLEPFTNYIIDIAVKNYQNMTTTASVSEETIQTAPDGGPQDVSIYPYNTSCVSVKWKTPPKRPNGVISQYRLRCYETDMKPEHVVDVEPALPASALSCGHRDGSVIFCDIYAYTSANSGSLPTAVNSTTQYLIEASGSGAGEDEEVSQGSSGFYEIPLPLLDISLMNHLEIKYQVIVSKATVIDNSRQKRQTSGCTRSIDPDRAGPTTFDPLLPHKEAQDCGLNYYLAAIIPSEDVKPGYMFPVGDGVSYGGVDNVALEEGSMYSVFYGVEINDPSNKVVVVQVLRSGIKTFTASRRTPITTPKAPSGSEIVAIAVGVSVACVVVTVLVVTILLIRRRQRHKKQSQAVETTRAGTNNYSNPPPEVSLRPTSTFRNNRNGSSNRQSEKFRNVKGDYENCPTLPSPTREESEAIPVDKLKWYIESNKELILDQFEKLKDVPMGETVAALIPENKSKCRYKDLYPVDEFRVLLKRLPSQGNDFINASHIMGYSQDNKYIAAQGPTNITVQDFWLMIWQQEVLSIVMATRTFETNKMKCVQYWPGPEEKKQDIGEFHITNVGQDQCPDFIVTQLLIKKGDEQKRLTHYQFISWPDHDVPETTQPFLTFYNAMKRQSSVKPGPLLLHCSAGVGRTGAIIALDYLLEQAKAESKVDIYKCVEKMRERRPNMIQTKEQYVFVHQVLYDALSTEGFLTLTDMFPSKIEDDLLLRREFQYIRETLSAVETITDSGRLPENAAMNRNPNILPDDKYRIYLNSRDGQTYINAIRVNGYRKVDQFYATQIPLEHTIKDFWQLAHERSCNVIVQLGETSDNTVFYPPKPGMGYSYGNNTHTITTKSLREQSGLHVYRLEHAIEKKNVMKEPRVYQETKEIALIKLPQKFCTKSQVRPMYIISIVEQIVKMNEKSEDVNVLVTSSDGAALCGLFICAFNCLESIRLTQDVEVHNQVLMAKHRRKEFVSSRDEYKHIYQILGAYVEQFSQYQNVSSM